MKLSNGNTIPNELKNLVSAQNSIEVLFSMSDGTPEISDDISLWDGHSIVLVYPRSRFVLTACALDVLPAPPHDGGGYLLLTSGEYNDMFVDGVKDLLVASGAVQKDDADPDECSYTLSFNPFQSTKLTDKAKSFGLDIIYDMPADCRFKEVRSISKGVDGKAISYRGDVPVDVQRHLLAEIAINDAALFYSRDFFVDNETYRSLTNYDHAKTLMSSLAIGHAAPKYPDYDQTSFPRWKKKVVNELFESISSKDTAKELEADIAAYKFYASLSVLWECVMSMPETNTMCVRIPKCELANAKLVNETMQRLARAIEIESYVDAYCAGVPIEDIFA